VRASDGWWWRWFAWFPPVDDVNEPQMDTKNTNCGDALCVWILSFPGPLCSLHYDTGSGDEQGLSSIFVRVIETVMYV